MKKHLLLVLTILLFSVTSVFSFTPVSGNISSNTTWTKANSPYILTGNVGVPAAYTLTIEAGVTVQRNADYQILINGNVSIKGTVVDSVIFSSSSALTDANSFFIEFQKSNLSNSTLRFISFHNQTISANNIRIGNEAAFTQTTPKNSGTLLISRSNLSYGNTTAKGYQATSKLNIDSCYGTSSTFTAIYPYSEPITITNSSIYNSTIDSQPYSTGITVDKTYLKNCQFLLGCCDANFTFSNSKVEDSKFIDGMGNSINGPVTLTNSIFLNTTVNNRSAAYIIQNSQFIITKNPLNLSGSQTGYILSVGNLNMSNSKLIDSASYNYSGVLLSGRNGDYVSGANSITNNIWSKLYDAIYITGASSITFNSNDLLNINRYQIANYSTTNFSALNNYFGLVPGKTINDVIFDNHDDLNYGLVTYTPYSNTLVNIQTASKPTNVFKASKTGGVLVSWSKNKEPNIKNYKVYWGYVNSSTYANSSTIAPTDSLYLIAGATVADSIAVTAINTNATGTNDQTNGFESAYSSATLKLPLTLTAFAPTSAKTGTQVTLTGTGFTRATAVTFGGIPATSFTVTSSTTINAVVGAGASGNISVTSPDSTISRAGFTFIPAPTITSYTPTTAVAGNTVTLTGTNFSGATAVTFGGVPATSFVVVSATSITAVVGTGAGGAIAVTTPGGTATIAGFTFIPAPTITSFAPTPAAAGRLVTLTGTNFSGTTAVTFGGTPAASFTVVSSTSITAVVGTGASGQIAVTAPGGTGTIAGFTFIPAPTIASFTPTTGPAGKLITLTGTNFNGTTAVTFGGTSAASFTVISSTTLTAVVSTGVSGAIVVTTQGGTATIPGFTFIPAPVITSFTPTASITGSIITITGTNFTGATAVNFGGIPATSFTVVSPTSITAVVASGATGVVSVVTPGGTGNLNGFSYTFNLPANNFIIAANSATCKGSTNGTITITAVKNLNYTVTISGSGTNSAYTFTNTTTINNLAAGTYSICFTVAGLSNYQQCFTIIVTEPKDLAVYTAVNINANNVTLNLDGASVYNVNLNGITTTVKSNTVTLALAKGVNKLSVTTDKLCQGVFEQQFDLSANIVPYPNPFKTSLSLNLGSDKTTNAVVSIYDLNNVKVYTKQLSNAYRSVFLDLSTIKDGIYILKLTTDNDEKTFKIIKNAN